ncbi:MAG: HD domain-containing protein [Nitrospiraceae bacterium]|nr:MAG: HD domain-containing protein [Nitrospiraceae bacterium]
MTENDLKILKAWFAHYTRSFFTSDQEDQKNINLKIEHTYHVCENIVRIANGILPGDNERRLAEAVALFHDVGRFPQYARYKTFKDAVSVNHGSLGAKTLISERVLENLPGDEQRLITEAVRFHSALSIPKAVDERTVFLLKMIRDADKLDIWRVFADFYEAPEEERASATAHGKPDTPGYSKEMLSNLFQKRIAPYSRVRNLNDFKIMNLSWAYDLHFRESFRLLLERNYVERIACKLPQTDEIVGAVKELKSYITEKLRENS